MAIAKYPWKAGTQHRYPNLSKAAVETINLEQSYGNTNLLYLRV